MKANFRALHISILLAVLCFSNGAEARQPEPQALIKSVETARIHYVTELTKTALDYLLLDRGPIWEKYRAGWDALNAEILRHPAPQDSDSNALSKLRVGKWQSPRHTYIFSSQGAWRMAPEDGTTSGHWHIVGNQYWDEGAQFTIILLTNDYFVFTDGTKVFFEWRIK